MIGVSTLADGRARGVKPARFRVLPRLTRDGSSVRAEYQRDAQGVWQGEETEAVLKPERR